MKIWGEALLVHFEPSIIYTLIGDEHLLQGPHFAISHEFEAATGSFDSSEAYSPRSPPLVELRAILP